MYVFGQLLLAVARVVGVVLDVYTWVVIIAVVLSWVNADPYNPIVQAIRSVTEPVFRWVRRRVPFAVVGMLDLSPFLVLLGVYFLKVFLVNSLVLTAYRLS